MRLHPLRLKRKVFFTLVQLTRWLVLLNFVDVLRTPYSLVLNLGIAVTIPVNNQRNDASLIHYL